MTRRWGAGYVPDHADVRGNLPRWSRVGSPMRSALVDPLLLAVPMVARDQSITNSCVPHARLAAVVVRAAQVGTSVPFGAVLPLYALARMRDLSGEAAPLVDTGCRPSSCAGALADWGFVPESRVPFDPARVNDRPSRDVLEESAVRLVAGHYAIDASGADRKEEIKRALSLGFPSCVALAIDDSFERTRAGEVIDRPRGSPSALHEVLVTGWIPGLNGTGDRFRILNSYGPLWGDSGVGYVRSDYVGDDALCLDADVITLQGDLGALADAS